MYCPRCVEKPRCNFLKFVRIIVFPWFSAFFGGKNKVSRTCELLTGDTAHIACPRCAPGVPQVCPYCTREWSTVVTSVYMKLLGNVIWSDINSPNTREWGTVVNSVNMKLLSKVVWPSTSSPNTRCAPGVSQVCPRCAPESRGGRYMRGLSPHCHFPTNGSWQYVSAEIGQIYWLQKRPVVSSPGASFERRSRQFNQIWIWLQTNHKIAIPFPAIAGLPLERQLECS